MSVRNELRQIFSAMQAERATGCRGAGGYLEYAKSLGYTRVEVLDWTSSAGDWAFLVSKDGEEWRVLWQTNNWPKPGFSYQISEQLFFGEPDDVMLELEELVDIF